MSENQPITIRFSDPGLHPIALTISAGYELDKTFANPAKRGYTRACVTANDKDYWMQCFLGCSTWFPITLHQELKPYFSSEDV